MGKTNPNKPNSEAHLSPRELQNTRIPRIFEPKTAAEDFS
jgi:hypothetical protein